MRPIDPTLGWLLRRMIDEWGSTGVHRAVDQIAADDVPVPAEAEPCRVTPLVGQADLLAAMDRANAARVAASDRPVDSLTDMIERFQAWVVTTTERLNAANAAKQRVRVNVIDSDLSCDWADCPAQATHSVEVRGASHLSCDVHLTDMLDV